MKLEFNNLRDLLRFNVKYYRYLNNISQEKLAELCSLSTRYLTDIERGIHYPTLNKIEKIACALNLEPYELFQNPDRDIDLVNKIKASRQYNQK